MRRTVTKSIAIIGEGETEWFYFDSLRVACRYPFKVAPDFPQHSDINHILKLVESYLDKQYDYIICLFDMDRLFQFPSEMQLYQRAKKKYGIKKYAGKVIFVETNPCTEFWVLLHFLPNVAYRRYENYDQLLPELQKYMPGYEKTKRYFIRTNLYKYLTETVVPSCTTPTAFVFLSMWAKWIYISVSGNTVVVLAASPTGALSLCAATSNETSKKI